MDYSSLLSADQKRSILEQRIAQFATEAYQHEINKKMAGDNAEAVAAADEALVILDNAIEIHQEELAKLPTAEQMTMDALLVILWGAIIALILIHIQHG